MYVNTFIHLSILSFAFLFLLYSGFVVLFELVFLCLVIVLSFLLFAIPAPNINLYIVTL